MLSSLCKKELYYKRKFTSEEIRELTPASNRIIKALKRFSGGSREKMNQPLSINYNDKEVIPIETIGKGATGVVKACYVNGKKTNNKINL